MNHDKNQDEGAMNVLILQPVEAQAILGVMELMWAVLRDARPECPEHGSIELVVATTHGPRNLTRDVPRITSWLRSKLNADAIEA